jgi:hypothetical protein
MLTSPTFQVVGSRLAVNALYRFDGIFLVSVDKVLNELFSSDVAKAIYEKLQRDYSTRRNEITEHPGDLLQLLEGTFGRGGKVVGRMIAEKIYRELGWQFDDSPRFGLLDYFEMVKSRFEEELQSLSFLNIGKNRFGIAA